MFCAYPGTNACSADGYLAESDSRGRVHLKLLKLHRLCPTIEKYLYIENVASL